MTRASLRAIYRMLVAPVYWRVLSMVRRALVRGASGDATAVTCTVQPMDGPAGEVHDAVECVMPPGFTAVPMDGSEAVLLCVAGDTGHPIVITSASRRLPGVAAGESSIHVDDVVTGARVIVRNNGDIEVQPGVGGVVRLGAASPAPAPAVARATDPVLLNETDIGTINALIAAWNLAQPGGGPLLSVPATTLTPITGTGTITAGGTGAIST